MTVHPAPQALRHTQDISGQASRQGLPSAAPSEVTLQDTSADHRLIVSCIYYRHPGVSRDQRYKLIDLTSMLIIGELLLIAIRKLIHVLRIGIPPRPKLRTGRNI